jgi:hypothetical protein
MDDIRIHSVSFGSESQKLTFGKIKLTCFLLDNGQRVLLKQSVQKSLGYDGKSENWLFEFLMNINRSRPVEPALLESVSKDIHIHRRTNDETTNDVAIDAHIFVDACKTIIDAKKEGCLFLSELKFAKAAEHIIEEIGNSNIEKMVDFATGYELFKHNHKEALVRFMINAGEQKFPQWVKTFPDHFFETIFSFQNWSWENLNRNPEKIADYFNEILFSRLDEIHIEELNHIKPKMKYRKGNTFEQYLEHPKLSAYILSVLALINASGRNKTIFEQLLNKCFPKQRDMKISGSEKKQPVTESVKLSAFNENLKKALFQKKK